ncbi:uncharacterized protein [Apostichopus japonicus]|uniref:uncharacterized protein isoform X1 n=2 Tax=Stichopus japonicus TaxID=307972 RepID=UPI003AB2EB9C
MSREGFTWPVALQLFLTIILILVLSCRGCQDVERQTFTSFLYDSPVLYCNVNDTNLSAWIFIDEGCNIPHILSHGNTTYSQRYSLSLTRTNYDLQLKASLRDAGMYFCKEDGQLKTSIELHVTVNGVIKVVVNTMARIPCPVQSITNTIWSFTMASDGKLTAIGTGSEIYPLHAAEYSVEVQKKFSSSYTTSYLVFNATADKIGKIMTCQESGISRTNATLEIEVPLIVWLEVNGTKIEKETLEVYSNVYTLIFCNATGKRLPPGGLSWKLNNKNQQNEIEEGNNDNFTWSSFGFKPRDDDRSLSCATNEQTKLRNVEISVKLNVLFPPKCYLDFRNESDDFSWTALCFCIGNPSVMKYELSHNGGAFQLTKELDFSTLVYPANITCRGTNSLSSVTINKYIPKVVSAPTVMPSSTRSSSKDDLSAGDNQTGILVLIIILIILIVSLLCAMVFGSWKYRLRSVSLQNTYFTGDQTNDTMATLSARPRLESPEIPRRIVNINEESYEVVPTNVLQTDPYETYQKPFSEESEYNETYFERASTSHQQNEYEVADENNINTIDRRKVVSTVSSTSTFSDEEYFRHGDNSFGGSTLKPQNKDTMSPTKSKKDQLRERKVKESVHWE